MDREEALALFQDLTGANEVVAEHVLEAMQWDLDSSVNFFLESGSVGFGGATVASPASPPDLIEEPDYEEELPRQRLSSRTAQQPPRSSPIEILDDDDDDDIQVLASSLGRRRATRADMIVEGDQVHPVGSLEDELEGGAGGGGGQGRRVRRNRRRMAGEMDRDLELLGQRFGVMTERPQQQSHRSQQQQPQQSQQQGLVQGPATMNGGSGGGGGSGDDEDMPELPADVDLQEQQMLMAAIQGGGYEGQLPDFAADPRYQPRLLSPGAQARQTLREEQDAAYHDSLRADREKQDAAERSLLEAEAAAAQQAAAAEAEERQQREEAERLERELRSKAERLPPEPAADDPDSINLAVRLPAGGRCSRRFRRSDPLQAVFDFVDVQQNGSGDLQPGSYSLATSYPRRVLESSAAARSLADAGLSAKQEALFLEPK